MKFWLAIIAATVLGFVAWHQHRTAVAYREISRIISSVTAITVYDRSGGDYGGNLTATELSTFTSASFPIEVFSAEAGCAEYRAGWPVWKDSALAILTLRDGTKRRASFHSFSGFFSLENVPGNFFLNGRRHSQFHQTYLRIWREEFVPKRNKPKETPPI